MYTRKKKKAAALAAAQAAEQERQAWVSYRENTAVGIVGSLVPLAGLAAAVDGNIGSPAYWVMVLYGLGVVGVAVHRLDEARRRRPASK